MPTIGYGYEVITPEYQVNLQNVDLITKVLLSKQKEYDTAYMALKANQKEALGIQFLNKNEQKKIDAFNTKISDAFSSGEFGDLSNSRVSDKYFALFDEIGKDRTLMSRYRQDSEYQKQLRSIEAKRNSKDPAKAGFGSINYAVFMNDLNEYANLDLNSPDAEGFVLRPYVDYVDIHAELADRMRDIPIQKFTLPTYDNGRIIYKTYTGRDPAAVKASSEEYMASRGAEQLRVQAAYAFLKAKDNPEFQAAIYNDHVGYNTAQQTALQGMLDKTMEDLKAAKDPDKIKELSGQQARIEAELGKAKTNLKSADQFFNRDKNDIINDLTSITLQDIVTSAETSYGGYAISYKVEPDRAFMEVAKMNQAAEQFKLKMKLEYDKLANDLEKERIKEGKSSSTSGSSSTDGNVIPGTSTLAADAIKPTYFSVTDPTHINFVSTVEDITASTQKLYALKTNVFKDGASHGDNKYSPENTTFEMLINPKWFDSSEYYADSPYVKAFKMAWDELFKTEPALAEYLGKRPTDAQGWDRLREAGQKITARVDQIMSQPKDRNEAEFMNQLQDINANLLSLEEFMSEANKSGDPAEFIKSKQNIKIYANAVYDFEYPETASKEQKARIADIENVFRPIFENNLDNPYAVKDDSSVKIGGKTVAEMYHNPNRVRHIPFGQISKVETGPDGTLKVFPKVDAFTTVTKGDEEDPIKSGVFNSDDKYLMIRDGNTYKQVPVTEIKAKGYFEMKAPEFNRLNWTNQLGITVGSKPQTRWDASSDGVSVPFDVRRNSVNNKIEVSIAGSKNWKEYPSADVSYVIKEVRKLISSNPYAKIMGFDGSLAPNQPVTTGAAAPPGAPASPR